MSLVPCPDGGKCGSSKHRQGSNAYNWCLYKASARARHQGKNRLSKGAPPSANDAQRRARREYMKLAKERSVYSVADCIVTEDMVIPERSVQSYINDPTKINDTYRKKWEDDIRKDIQEKSEDILAKLGLDGNDLGDDELDIVMGAAYHADNSDIAGAMARNMRPRTFRHYCSPTRGGHRDAFKKAMANHEVGSAEWYETLAEGYCYDLNLFYSDSLGRRGAGKPRDDDRDAVVSALKQAIGDNLDEIDEWYRDELPDVEVVWTGELSDVGPGDGDERLHIRSPYVVFSYNAEEILSDPTPLRGEYAIFLPGMAERRHGAESDILDDMSIRRGRYFDYPDGVGLDQYVTNGVYRTNS